MMNISSEDNNNRYWSPYEFEFAYAEKPRALVVETLQPGTQFLLNLDYLLHRTENTVKWLLIAVSSKLREMI